VKFSCFIKPGSQEITGVRKENGGVGRAALAQHPHIFPYFTAIPNEPKTGESLQTAGFDSLVVCVVGSSIKPTFPGMNQAKVVQAIDLFFIPELTAHATNIVVVGAGAVDGEAAHFIAAELAKKVTMVEQLPYIMPGLYTANRGDMIHELERLQVPLWNCTRFVGIERNTVRLARNISVSVPDPSGTWAPLLPENIHNPFARQIKAEIQEQTLTADLVVLAIGLRPTREFYEACVSSQVAPEVILLGDAFQIGSVQESIKSGSLAGRNL